MGLKLIGNIRDPQFASLATFVANPARSAVGGFRRIGHINDPQFAPLLNNLGGAPQPAAPPQEKTTPAMPDPSRNNARWISDREAANLDIIPNERVIALKHLLPEVEKIGNDAYSDQTGQWYPLTPEGRVQFQRMDEQAARVDAQKDSLPILPTALAPLRSAGQDISALNARALNAVGVESYFGEKLDPETLNNMALAGNETDAAASAVSGDSTAKRYVRGGIRSATTSLIGNRLAGPAGAIGIQAGISGNQSYAEAKQAGLSDADAKAHAIKMAAAEGGIATVFQWMGLGGMERGLAKESLKKPLKEAFKQFGIRTLKEELPEELLTQVAQTMIGDQHKFSQLAETNPDGTYWNEKDGFSPRVQAYVDTVGQTGVAMGMSDSARYIMARPENVKAYVTRNPEQAKAIAAIENPSRGDLERNGITGARNTTPEQRATLAKSVRQQLAAVEPVEDEAGLPEASVKDWGSGKTVSREAQDALGKYVSQNFYSDPKRASIRDADTKYQELKAAADAEKRSNAAIEAQDSRIGGMVDRQQAQREIAAGKVDRENVKYAELHDLEPELRTRIQQEAQRQLENTDSDATRAALEKIIQDAGSDVGAKVESEKERIVKVLTGELDQRTINEKEHQPPRSPDPIVQGLLMPLEERRARLSQAIRNFSSDSKDEWVDYARERAYARLNAGQEFDFDKPAVEPDHEAIGSELMAMADVLGVSDKTETTSEAQPATEPAPAAQPETEVPPPEPAAVAQPEPYAPLSPAAEAGVRSRYKTTSGHDLGQFVAPEADHAEAVDFMKARRKRLQFFRSPSGVAANSFYDPDTKTVYVNADEKGDALWYTVGHEYAHASGADLRLGNLPAEVIDAAKLKYAEGASPTYLKTLQKNPQKWTREAVARYMGEVLADPAQRAQIRKENPTLWQKIIEGIKSLFSRNKVPPSVRRVLDEFNDLPPQGYRDTTTTQSVAAAPPASPPNTPPTAATGGNGRYDNYAGFANPLKGTDAGEAAQAVAEGMGATERDQRPRTDRLQDASAEYAVEPDKVRAELDAALKSNQPLSDRQTDLLNIVRSEAATKALASNDPDDLAAVARLNVAYLKKRSEAGKSLQSGTEEAFQTPEGRGVLIAQALTDLSADDLAALESAKAELKRLGGDPSLLLSDEGPLLADVFDKETARKTAEEKAAIKNALRDDKIARAAANVVRLERSIAQKQAAFRAKMEAKGILPATPQGMAALLADPQKSLYALREMRAYKNLARGKSLPFLPGIGHKGMLDALYEASMANILSGVKTMVVNAAGTPLNYLGHLVPRAVEATGNAALRAATGGRAGTTGAQWGEVRHLLQGMMNGVKQGFMNANASIWHEQSMLDQQSGRHGSALEGHGHDYAIPGRLGWLIRTPGYGTNRYMDDLSRTTIAHMEARANAYRDGVENGLTGSALEQHVDALYNDPDSSAWQGDLRGAYEYANKMAFQESGGETRKKIVNALSSARRDIPGVRWFLRFIKFPVNAAVQTKEWTPFHIFHVVDRAAANMRAGREWSYGIKEDIAKAFVGTLVLYSIMGDLEDDEREGDFGITGSSHPDPEKRNSLRFGDTYVSYRAMDPFGSALALLADTGLSIKKHGFGANSATSALASVADTVANKPTMRGINDISAFSREVGRARAEGDPEIINKAARKLAAQQSLSFMPRLITSFTEAAGEGAGYEQRKRTAAELFDLDISDIASQYDVWGNKKSDAVMGNPVGDFAYKLLSPAGITIQPQHPGDELIGRWNATVDDPKKRFRFTELSTDYRKDGERRQMTPQQFQQYAELAGQIAAELYDAGNFDPEHPTEQQIAALKKNFETARDKAKELLHEEWNGGKKATATTDELATTIRQAQIRGLREKVSSKFTFKLKPGETASTYQKRLQSWKSEREGAAEELKRLFASPR